MADPAPQIPDGVELLFVIGAQKAGTTWLHDMFQRNGAWVLVQDQKEVDFWNTHYAPFTAKYRRRAKLKYLRAALWTVFGTWRLKTYDYAMRRLHHRALHDPMPAAMRAYVDFLFYRRDGQPVVADVSPNYALLDADALRAMAGMSGAKFLLLLRDPVERAISAVNYTMMAKNAGDAPFDDRFAAFLQTDDPHGDYPRLLSSLSEIVPADRWTVLFYEDLFTPEAAARIAAFLGTPPFDIDTGRTSNKSTRFGRPEKDLYGRALERYRDVYAFCDQFFEGRLPEKWRTNLAMISES